MLSSVTPPGPIVLSEIALEIDRDEVLRFQGYKKGGALAAQEGVGLYDTAMAEGARLMAPRVAYQAIAVEAIEPHAIRIPDGPLLHIPNIGRFWGRITHLGMAIATIGPALEERSRALFDSREFPLAVMLDSVGSAAVECLAEWTNDQLCQVALAEGLKVTNRISPGYAGWDVAQQKLLFDLLPAELVGVRLNDYCFMTPEKTISLCVGIGPDARVDHYFVQCRRCTMRDCPYRRAQFRPPAHG